MAQSTIILLDFFWKPVIKRALPEPDSLSVLSIIATKPLIPQSENRK